MDFLVRLDSGRIDSPVLAHVNSLPVLPFGTRSRREVITLYGSADANSLALALAATVESDRLEVEAKEGVVRHIGVWPDRGAQGDTAWRDDKGKLVTRDLDIPLATLQLRAAELLGKNGPELRRVAAGLSMPDWPEGTDRAVSFSLSSSISSASSVTGCSPFDDSCVENWLDMVREADAYAFEEENSDEI